MGAEVVRVGLAGCGVVGGALVELLSETSDSIESRYGVRFEVSKVLVRDTSRDRGLTLPRSIFTNDRSEFLSHDADLVVEAIGGCDAAREIAHASLEKGKRFVTANKELIASDGAELASLARSRKTVLDFGASVGGSAPVITLLRDVLGTSTPTSVRGILNGTSNFVLTLLERGAPIDEALAQARRKGLAECDASRDLDGRDIAAKLAIITWISFGIAPSRVEIPRIGITEEASRLVEVAASLGGRVRLIGECRRLRDGRVTAFVEPVVFSEHNAFAQTHLEDNRIEVDLGWSAPLTVSGPGAGGRPTATALLGDILNLSPRANDGIRESQAAQSVGDPRAHRWLVTTRDGWKVFRATRHELNAAFPIHARTADGAAVARVELPLVTGEIS